jgi:superfamily II DNA or RNA helicase
VNNQSSITDQAKQIPRVGSMALVRNRHGIIAAVTPYQSNGGPVLHLVDVEYTDSEGTPAEQILWELEARRETVAPGQMPQPSSGQSPMLVREFDALVRSVRWSAFQPFVSPDHGKPDDGAACLSSPFHAAIQTEDYQLVPLLKAMAMPRISLLIADDVGLGKTIEAGLILSELIQRRRIRRVLVICPATLRHQWQRELDSKFSLSFDVIDRPQTLEIRRRLGPDANPWRQFPRIITSYHYLRQADVLEEFRAAAQTHRDSPNLAWDLLIVDEAHNLAPAPLGKESELSRLLGQLAPYFEHKLFLSATPHNGHTRSFSGLLERLDPVRFTRTSEMSDSERKRVRDVNVRRLKSEINALSDPPRFCDRFLREVPLSLSREELALSAAFADFRTGVRRLTAPSGARKLRAGRFAVELLGKRLLSCPFTFSDSWSRIRVGLKAAETATEGDLAAAERAVREEIDDDLEAESRQALAASAIGAWLHPLAAALAGEIVALESALAALGLDTHTALTVPRRDARVDALIGWIERNLRNPDGTWKHDERLIVFTEYKTTLDYLQRRLLDHFKSPDALLNLFGDLDQRGRDRVTTAFNDANHPVRVLIATDAASEGLNLQETARYVLHFDIPWNPARLEQRNGRLDRHGQARDVCVHHFTSSDDQDLAFLARIVEKVHQIRTDLGATGEIFCRGFERRFIEGEDARSLFESIVADADRRRARADVGRDATATPASAEHPAPEADLAALAREIDFDPATLCNMLETAFSLGWQKWPVFAEDRTSAVPRFKFATEVPRAWDAIVDDSLRMSGTRALPFLTFDPGFYLDSLPDGRKVFRPKPETTLLHLAHPVFRQAFSTFARERFRDAGRHRWLVRHASLPAGADAVVLLHVEEMAVNELRETFHHWTRTLAWPIANGQLGPLLAHRPPAVWRDELIEGAPDAAALERAVSLWDDVEDGVSEALGTWKQALTGRLATRLVQAKVRALAEESERYQSRQGEISRLIQNNRVEMIQRELEDVRNDLDQGFLFAEFTAERERMKETLEEELTYRTQHLESLREYLTIERERILNRLIPARHTLSGAVQVLPVALEIRLPAPRP